MADTSPVRKSARRRAADKKYTNDAFEGLNLDILSSDSEKEAIKIEKLQDNKNDDDFPADALQEPDEEGEEDTVADSVAENMSDGSAIQTPVEVYEDAHSYASSDGIEPLTLASNTTKPKGQIRTTKGDSNVHSRGMPENPLKKDDWKDRPYLLAGSGVEDVAHILNSREQWASDPILPRKTKMCHSFSHTKEKRRMEATVGWDWYYAQGGREAFAKKQKVRILNSDDGARYVPRPTQRSHSFLMGPYGDQKLFTLSPLQTVELDETWNSASTASSGQPNQTVHGSIRGRRHGWILNVGANVKCMDWATNCDGDKQYLALSTAQIKASSPQKEPPAFTPAPPTPSCIQIWAFPSTTDSNSSLDSSRLPALRLVLCTEWGGAKQLKWCPMPRKIRDQETIGKLFVGLLAGVWTDGYVRVLEVQLDQMEAATTIYQRFDSAIFTARPPNTLSTCCTWLSASDIAVGHSNGFLAIYNIYPQDTSRGDVSVSDTSQPKTNLENQEQNSTTVSGPNGSQPPRSPPKNQDENPNPWLYLPIHPTYVLTLISAYPSHPTLLISSSMSGHLRLTSLRTSQTDYVLSARSRWPPTSIAYCDALFTIIAPEDSSECIKAYGLRCLYSSLTVGRIPSPVGPGLGVIDVGKFHSSIAVGTADGSVTVTNPMRKVLGKPKAKGWQQCIFKHEWVRRPGSSNEGDKNGGRQGMSRITEGYKVEKADSGLKSGKRIKDVGVTTTIYEEETAVTALAWNPNLSCGGWLAVGWGSGLLRVQDVSI